MSLTSKNSLLLISTLFILGYADILQAECVLQLTNRSDKVKIINNKCTIDGQIALNSTLELQPSELLWAESQTEQKQVICQNSSSNPINISVNSNKAPWIGSSRGSIACSSWKDDKMVCSDGNGNTKALSCAIVASNPRAVDLKQPTEHASVPVRSTLSGGDED